MDFGCRLVRVVRGGGGLYRGGGREGARSSLKYLSFERGLGLPPRASTSIKARAPWPLHSQHLDHTPPYTPTPPVVPPKHPPFSTMAPKTADKVRCCCCSMQGRFSLSLSLSLCRLPLCSGAHKGASRSSHARTRPLLPACLTFFCCSRARSVAQLQKARVAARARSHADTRCSPRESRERAVCLLAAGQLPRARCGACQQQHSHGQTLTHEPRCCSSSSHTATSALTQTDDGGALSLAQHARKGKGGANVGAALKGRQFIRSHRWFVFFSKKRVVLKNTI